MNTTDVGFQSIATTGASAAGAVFCGAVITQNILRGKITSFGDRVGMHTSHIALTTFLGQLGKGFAEKAYQALLPPVNEADQGFLSTALSYMPSIAISLGATLAIAHSVESLITPPTRLNTLIGRVFESTLLTTRYLFITFAAAQALGVDPIWVPYYCSAYCALGLYGAMKKLI